MTVHRIKLKDLNTSFIKKLQSENEDENAQLEIRVYPSFSNNSENEFWKTIQLLDWEKSGDDDAILEPAIEYLSKKGINEIKAFQDVLSEKLFHLDGQKFAENIGENSYSENGYFSVDNFLYARCCVVANGQEFYEHVLKKPTEMPKNLTFEALLYLANKAHLRKTGNPLKYIPTHNFETFFNTKAWGIKTARL